MDKGLKWLGVCILLSAIVLSAASVYKAKINIDSKAREAENQERYIYKVPDNSFIVIDKETGNMCYYYYGSDEFVEFNPVTKYYKETKIE